MSVLGFEWAIFRSAFISGIALGALYGIVAVSLVLTYRMSRIVGFVHGGIALATAFVYWYLTANPRRTSGAGTGGWAYETREWPKIPALLLALVVAAALGFVAGALFTGRMATWPRVTLTTCSLGAMLLLTGFTESIWTGAFEIVPSPFGPGRTNVFGYLLSHHQIAVIIILVVVVVSLHLVVSRTMVGVQLRGIADDVEACEMVGVPVRRVSLGVWTVAGALAGLSGVLLTSITRLSASTVLFVLLRSMAGASLGGFESLLLALLGAMIFGQVESHVQGGTFGSISSGWREVILMTVLTVGVLVVTRLRALRLRVREV